VPVALARARLGARRQDVLIERGGELGDRGPQPGPPHALHDRLPVTITVFKRGGHGDVAQDSTLVGSGKEMRALQNAHVGNDGERAVLEADPARQGGAQLDAHEHAPRLVRGDQISAQLFICDTGCTPCRGVCGGCCGRHGCRGPPRAAHGAMPSGGACTRLAHGRRRAEDRGAAG